jgi:hypothetical protein
MRLKWTCYALAGLTWLVPVEPAAAQSAFQWHGSLAPGQTIEIKNLNGAIRAVPSTSGEITVIASKKARRSNPDEVRLDVVSHGQGITICAVYPAPPGEEPNRCEAGTGGRSSTRDNDTTVDFDVQVPAGVAFVGRTVNGKISGQSLQGDAEAHTVNGSVQLSTTGLAVANTVNGSVDVTMGRTDWPNGATFKTVNGAITVTLPGSVSANVRADVASGNITSDFPISIGSGTSPRSLRGTIGGGGRDLTLSTVNGSIRLLRAP